MSDFRLLNGKENNLVESVDLKLEINSFDLIKAALLPHRREKEVSSLQEMKLEIPFSNHLSHLSSFLEILAANPLIVESVGLSSISESIFHHCLT